MNEIIRNHKLWTPTIWVLEKWMGATDTPPELGFHRYTVDWGDKNGQPPLDDADVKWAISRWQLENQSYDKQPDKLQHPKFRNRWRWIRFHIDEGGDALFYGLFVLSPFQGIRRKIYYPVKVRDSGEWKWPWDLENRIDKIHKRNAELKRTGHPRLIEYEVLEYRTPQPQLFECPDNIPSN